MVRNRRPFQLSINSIIGAVKQGRPDRVIVANQFETNPIFRVLVLRVVYELLATAPRDLRCSLGCSGWTIRNYGSWTEVNDEDIEIDIDCGATGPTSLGGDNRNVDRTGLVAALEELARELHNSIWLRFAVIIVVVCVLR